MLVLRWFILLFFLSGLYSCSSVFKNPHPNINASDSTSVFQRTLDQADQALAAKDFSTAATLVKSLDKNNRKATSNELAHANIIGFELSLHEDNLFQAIQQMSYLDNIPTAALPVPLQARYYQSKIDLLQKLNRPLPAIDLRIKHAKLLYPDKLAAHSEILSALLTLSTEDIKQGISQNAAKSITRGWYELALAVSENLWDVPQQKHAIRIWLNKWRKHPASSVLPDYIAQILKQKLESSHIALALPFTGQLAEVSKAIVTGFDLVYQSYLQEDPRSFRLSKIDTSSKSAADILNEAKAIGANFVIGPLVKTQVEQLERLLQQQRSNISSQPEQHIQFLALNFSDAKETKPVPGFYQFGFNVADEIYYLADQAYAAGYRKIAVLADKGDWGKGASDLLVNKWKDSGGQMLDTYYFNSDTPNDFVSKVAAVSTSMKVNHADALFFFGKPDQARQLRPFLSFNKLAGLTVFATSHIYTNNASLILDQDLEGIYYSETPWVMEQRSNLNERVLIKDGAKAKPFGRFYALGVDTMIILQHLNQLSTDKSFSLPGLTGNLSMTDHQIIRRKPLLVRIHDSKPMLVNNIVAPVPAVMEKTKEK